jgi:hypothetical protein
MYQQPNQGYLSEAELQEKRKALVEPVIAQIQQVQPIDNGFEFRFNASNPSLSTLCELIEFERKCSPFLRFELLIASQMGPVKLTIAGPAGTQDLLKTEFKLSRLL